MTEPWIRGAIGLIGGAAGNLDAVDGDILYDNDVYFTTHNGNICFHQVDTTVGGTESSPILITPDTDPGSKRHVLLGMMGFTYEWLWMPISQAIDGTAAPAAIGTLTSTNGKVQARAFDSTSAEDVRFPWAVPSDIDPTGKVQYYVLAVVSNATGPSAKGISFELSGYCSGYGDTLTGTFGTVVVSEKTAMTEVQYDVIKTVQSADVTITDLAAGELAMLKFARNPANASDDYAYDIDVTGIFIRYKRIIGLGIA